MGIDDLVNRGLDLGEDPEPTEGVVALEASEHSRGDRPAADAVEAVASGEDVALELPRPPIVDEADTRPIGRQVVHPDVAGLKEEWQPARDARTDQILDDLRLAVNHDRASRQLAEPQAVTLDLELELDPAVREPLAFDRDADAELGEEVGVALLDHTGADPLLAVLAAARLDDDRLDPLGLEDPRQGQPTAGPAPTMPTSVFTRFPRARCPAP
jgi:hypothetical protein